MKVLVTGGYGFIGSFVSEKFHREGHEIIIVDNLSSGNVANCDFQHSAFILDVESRLLDMIFQHHEIDIVVHLAAQINIVASIKDPYADTKSNILGLTNLLQLSAKHRVKKFLFASSAAVYGMSDEIPLSEQRECNPITPYGINKLLGEYYCNKWNELYGLDTLCLRFSNVYGPRQGAIGDGGVISSFMERLKDKKPLVVYGNGNQTRDFIYVEDIAEGIYRASQTQVSGAMNLSTNDEHSINEVIEILSETVSIPSVVREAPRSGDIFRSRLDNTFLKDTLHWEPGYSLNQGLKSTYEWFVKSTSGEQHVDDTSDQIQSNFSEQFIRNELVASSLSRNIRSLYLTQIEHYVDGIPVLKPEVFSAVLRSRQQALQKFNTPYVLIPLKESYSHDIALLQRIHEKLRETDYIGLTNENAICILLSNTKQEDANHAIDRLNNHGIPSEVFLLGDAMP